MTTIAARADMWRTGEQLSALGTGLCWEKDELLTLVDRDDIYCLMIGTSDVGKTACFYL